MKTSARAEPVWEPKVRRSDRVSAALDDLWRATRTHELNPSGRRELRPRLRPVIDEARAAGLYAEQLLSLMKESWRAFPNARGEDREQAREQLDGIITLCIEEFYRER